MAAFLSAFAPDPDALLAAVARQVDDAMVREIAITDYGFRVEEHVAGIEAVKALAPPAPLPWTPREVLELTRWWEPDVPEMQGGAKGARGHWMRAFACAALVRAACAPGGDRGALHETLTRLVASLDALDAGLHGPAASLFAWGLPALGEGEAAERVALGAALLWCALRADVGDDDTITALCTWIAAHHRQRRHVWVDLGAQLADHSSPRLAPETIDWVRLIGAALAGGD